MATTSKRKSANKAVAKAASKQAAARPAGLAAKAAAVPASGPLTMDEARYTKRAELAARKLAPPAATSGTVGLERKRGEQEPKAEIARRRVA